MTRKRKNIQEQDDKSADTKSSGFEGYGYNNYSEEDYSKGNKFPEKKFQNSGRARFGNKKQKFGEKDFERNYGPVGGGEGNSQWKVPKEENNSGYGDESETMEKKFNPKDNDGRGEFPKEIVGYLRNIDQIRKQEGSIEEFILDKCVEEVSGMETTLLEWTEAAVVVESVFGASPYGSALFLNALCRLKHKKLIDLFFSGASARTIENLIYKLCPIESNEHVKIIEKFTDLLCDNWTDSVTCGPSSFLLRCILRSVSGLGAKSQKKEEEKPKFSNAELKSEMKKVYEKIATLVFDENLNKDLIDNSFCCLVIQDAIDMDSLWKGRKADDLIAKITEKDEGGDQLRSAWKGKGSSRIWEKIMENCREESRSIAWMGAISGNVQELANHQFANYPLQKLIGGVQSLELATDIVDEISGFFTSLLVSDKIGVAKAAIKCASKHEAVQEQLIKQLRLHFRASKASNKTHFMMNVLSNNSYDGQTFDLQQCTVQGSILLGELLQFSKVKTLSACIEALNDDQIVQMSCHKIASRVIQAIFQSSTIGDEIKNKIVEAFSKDRWEQLVADVYGSHVFEKIWDYVDVKRKQEIMKILVGIYNTSKFWKFAMLRCDVHLFRKDRKGWVEKMKSQRNK